MDVAGQRGCPRSPDGSYNHQVGDARKGLWQPLRGCFVSGRRVFVPFGCKDRPKQAGLCLISRWCAGSPTCLGKHTDLYSPGVVRPRYCGILRRLRVRTPACVGSPTGHISWQRMPPRWSCRLCRIGRLFLPKPLCHTLHAWRTKEQACPGPCPKTKRLRIGEISSGMLELVRQTAAQTS